MNAEFAQGIVSLLHRSRKEAAIGPVPLPKCEDILDPIEARIKARHHRQLLSETPKYKALRDTTAALSQAFELYIYEILRGTGERDAVAIALEIVSIPKKRIVTEFLAGQAVVMSVDDIWLRDQAGFGHHEVFTNEQQKNELPTHEQHDEHQRVQMGECNAEEQGLCVARFEEPIETNGVGFRAAVPDEASLLGAQSPWSPLSNTARDYG